MKKVTIIDCGIGNRASIRNMLKKLSIESCISNEIRDILSSDVIILPGVGAFDAFMQSLESCNLIIALNKAVFDKKIPLLGICLGMQVLFETSEEGRLKGLSWLNGDVCSLRKRFGKQKIPHIGWKDVELINNSFFSPNNQYYFLHSYYCNPKDSNDVFGYITIDNQKIVVAVKKNNVYGVQFHPEKSHRYGLSFFQRFFDNVS